MNKDSKSKLTIENRINVTMGSILIIQIDRRHTSINM